MTCHAYTGICSLFQQKNLCETSALFPEHCTGINLVLLPHPEEHCGALPPPQLPSTFRRKARLCKLLNIFNSY